jgi:hypothetical protein
MCQTTFGLQFWPLFVFAHADEGGAHTIWLQKLLPANEETTSYGRSISGNEETTSYGCSITGNEETTSYGCSISGNEETTSYGCSISGNEETKMLSEDFSFSTMYSEYYHRRSGCY